MPVNPDPQNTPRQRRFDQRVSEILNDLERNGDIEKTANGWEVVGGTDPNSVIYPVFTPGANDDEFADASFSGWTAVNDGSNVPTVTETNGVASVLVPGGHAAADLAAYLKAVTPATGDTIEVAVRGLGTAQNFNIVGLLFADGATYGAGNQVTFYYSPTEAQFRMYRGTNFSAQASATAASAPVAPYGDVFLRMKYAGANSWEGYVSPDGVSWALVLGPTSHTLTPTQIGFFVTSWGGTLPFVWAIRYFKKLP